MEAVEGAFSPGSMFEMKSAETAAHALSLAAETFALPGPDDIAAAFDKIVGHADGIYAVPDPLISTIRHGGLHRIGNFLDHGLPTDIFRQ